MDIATILTMKYAGSEWELEGDSYEGLTWLSKTPKPDKKTLESLWSEIQAELQTKAENKAQAKASAVSKLQNLGLTVEEVEAAFGLRN
jgi:hypothetical protein